jgi:hypothetical protein
MQKIYLFIVACMILGAVARAENPQALSLLKEKNFPVQGFVGLSFGDYSGRGQGHDDAILPQFYVGLKPVCDWEVFDTPVEFDLGESAQLSLRNIEGSPWSAGVGVNYNLASVRERHPTLGNGPPGYDWYDFGPYAYGRYQATKEVGFEVSQRLDYYFFDKGPNPALGPDNYFQTETRFLVDVDCRRMDPRPEVRDSGFYAGVYGFAQQRPDDITSGTSTTTLVTYPDNTLGVGGMTEYLWQPWLSGNFGIVLEGEMTFDPDQVRLGRTDNDRGRGHFYPHLLINQDVWPGGSIEVKIGQDLIFSQFGESNRNPSYFHSGITLGQHLSEHIAVALTYDFNDNPYKATRTNRDQTGPHYVGVTTTYNF